MTKAQVTSALDLAVGQQGNEMGLGGVKAILDQFVALIYGIAPEYDATSTYAKNALVIYDGKLYAAKAAIQTAEAWTAAHWEERTLAAAIALKADAQ